MLRREVRLTRIAPSLGAPGIYTMPDEPIRSLTGARMDVCAFVGVAPRGPARPPRFDADWSQAPSELDRANPPRTVAVPIESFDAYRRLFGGFEGPGLLPYSVASFFEQGGQRAYIVRVVHDYRLPSGDQDVAANALRVARSQFSLSTADGTALAVRARNEGSWGNALRVVLSFGTRPIEAETVDLRQLTIPLDSELTAGTLLRLTLPGGSQVLRYVDSIVDEWPVESSSKRRVVRLALSLSALPEHIEIVEANCAVDDNNGRTEFHQQLGLSSLHPRWLAAVLYQESILIYPEPSWINGDIALVDTHLVPVTASPFEGGDDRYQDIEPGDFFDSDWVLGDPYPGDGIHAVVNLADLGMLVIPDLYSPEPLAPIENIASPTSLAGPSFERCVQTGSPAPQSNQPPDLDGLRLDPESPDDLRRIIQLQQQVVELAEQLQSFTVLLDVPPRLHQRGILQWRSQFRSTYAAGYWPWLRVSRLDDGRDGLIRVPPTAVAAGIIAQRELAVGIPFGPANVIAVGVVDVDDQVSPARHDELHPQGINVFLPERDGIRLTAARTLGRDPAYRQLSVRRLVTLLKRTLDQQMQWAVFEPNNASLRADIRQLLRQYLRQLYRANAFRGATEDEAFFVRCDDALNPTRVVDAGQLIVEIGVAPAEPLEFIVLRMERGGDGTLRLEG